MPGSPDGPELARLLAAALAEERSGGDALDVVDERADVTPTADGTVAYAVADGGARLAEVAVQPDRVHLAVRAAPEAAARAAATAELRVRPKAVRPPQTLVFVESAAEVNRAADVLDAVRAERG
ncbi:MAG: hypothetical protein ABEJ26_10305 [Halosimplex sp.]